jgi:hypothetical protein
MCNLKQISILFCGISLSLGGVASAKKCEIFIDPTITREECSEMKPSKSAKGHCATGQMERPGCVWSAWQDFAGHPTVGCWAQCGAKGG